MSFNRKERSIALLAGHAAVLWWVFPRMSPYYRCIESVPEFISTVVMVCVPVVGVAASWFALSKAAPDEEPASDGFANFENLSLTLMGVMLAAVLWSPFSVIGNRDDAKANASVERLKTCLAQKETSTEASVPR